MAEYENRVRGMAAADVAIDMGLRAYMLRVYNYMLMGLALTGGTAWFTASVPAFRDLFFQQVGGGFTLSMLGWVVLLAPLGLVFFLSWRINQMSFAAAQATFWFYAGLMGIGLTPVLLLYTGTSVAQVFFITSATFGAMSLYGYTTKRDLSGFGSFLFMGLVGIIIASLVNMFLQSSMMQWVISVMGGLRLRDYPRACVVASQGRATIARPCLSAKPTSDFRTSFGYVAPVGLLGSITTIARVADVTTRAR